MATQFVAKFSQVTSDRFSTNDEGKYPYLGTVLSGSYHSSIINAQIFEANKLKENTLYLCQNIPAMVDGERLMSKEGAPLFNTEVLVELSFTDYLAAKKEFGDANRIASKVKGSTNTPSDPSGNDQPELIDEKPVGKAKTGKTPEEAIDPVLTESELNAIPEDVK